MRSPLRRRAFLTLLGSAAAMAAIPAAPRAQQPMPRIGYMMTPAEDEADNRARHAAFLEGLEKRGWVEDRNVRVDYRWNVVGPDQARATAAELVGLAPTVLVTQGSPNVQALRRATAT